ATLGLIRSVPKTDAPRPLPPEIVKAWTDAGVKVGWMRMSKFEYDFEYGDVGFIRDDAAPPGELLAFRYGTPSCVPLAKQPPWRAGGLARPTEPGARVALEMWATPVKDAGLKELAAFKSMQMLNLAVTLVSDAGMKELAGLKNLQSLNVGYTKVT